MLGLQMLTLIGVIDCKDFLINPQMSSLSLLFDITTSSLLVNILESSISQVSWSGTKQFSKEITFKFSAAAAGGCGGLIRNARLSNFVTSRVLVIFLISGISISSSPTPVSISRT